jgi:hypothetical protein
MSTLFDAKFILFLLIEFFWSFDASFASARGRMANKLGFGVLFDFLFDALFDVWR